MLQSNYKVVTGQVSQGTYVGISRPSLLICHNRDRDDARLARMHSRNTDMRGRDVRNCTTRETRTPPFAEIANPASDSVIEKVALKLSIV